MTALHIAARDGYKGVVKLLLNNGAHVNAVDIEGQTSLDYANAENTSGISRILKAAGGKKGK